MMHPDIHAAFAGEHIADLHRSADRFRLRRRAKPARRPAESLEPIVIRAAVDSDRPAIQRLAELESRPASATTPIVAIRGDQLTIAFDPESGMLLADPFVPTANAARMVRAYADAELASSA
jgi:hypothetical protein